jgi:hypothetical protein
MAAPLNVRCSVVVKLAQAPTPSAAASAMIAGFDLMDHHLVYDDELKKTT